MSRKYLPLLLLFVLTLPSPVDAQIVGSSGDGWSMRGSDPIAIYKGEKLITKYNFGVEEGKPYFYPVIGPTAENMTRHWPMEEGHEGEETDHIHHLGMWYGLGKVNGLDFWHFPQDKSKQDRTFGVIRHKGMNGVTMTSSGITFRVKSDWLAALDLKKRVCSDTREFNLYHRKDGALVVDTKLTLIADAGDLTIKDDKEGAWSIRTLPSLRLEGDVATGQIINSEGEAGRDAWGKRAAWVDYYGKDRAGNDVGIAILDHPSNLRHPTWWHARHYGLFAANPFGQGHFEKDATENAGDYTIAAGENLVFRYRTIFHKGDEKTAKIAEEFAAFSGE